MDKSHLEWLWTHYFKEKGNKKKLENKDDEWINIDVLVSKQGKWYCAENNFKPKANPGTQENNEPQEDIPF